MMAELCRGEDMMVQGWTGWRRIDRMVKDGQDGGGQEMMVEERIVHNDGGGQKSEER